MSSPRPIAALALATLAGQFWPSNRTRADAVPLDVAWFASAPSSECEGPCDAPDLCWQHQDFDDSLWEPAALPLSEMVSGIQDRFFRGRFTVDSVQPTLLSFSSDDGIDIYVNSQPVGSWGAGCHSPGCVNMSGRCGINLDVDPVDISGYLVEGENLIALHVSNCNCCCSMYVAAELWLESLPVQGPSFRRGDTTGDGALDLADPIVTLNCLFLGGPCFPCQDVEDSNDDGVLDLTDPVLTLTYLFLAGQPPAPPQDQCGPDPSPDGLRCDVVDPACR
jgi:hypothetical protein